MPKVQYQLEKRSLTDWIVYKLNPLGEIDVGYQVELDHYEPGAHRCSCPHGEHQKWEKGKPLKTCRHINMVLEELK